MSGGSIGAAAFWPFRPIERGACDPPGDSRSAGFEAQASRRRLHRQAQEGRKRAQDLAGRTRGPFAQVLVRVEAAGAQADAICGLLDGMAVEAGCPHMGETVLERLGVTFRMGRRKKRPRRRDRGIGESGAVAFDVTVRHRAQESFMPEVRRMGKRREFSSAKLFRSSRKKKNKTLIWWNKDRTWQGRANSLLWWGSRTADGTKEQKLVDKLAKRALGMEGIECDRFKTAEKHEKKMV